MTAGPSVPSKPIATPWTVERALAGVVGDRFGDRFPAVLEELLPWIASLREDGFTEI
jgi:hypothetical protein